MELTHNVLSRDAYWMVNKKLAKSLGIEEALFLSDIISKEKYFIINNTIGEDGYFYNSQENIEKDTTITPYKQRKITSKLESLRLINTYISRTNTGDSIKHFKINHEQILKILVRGCEETSFPDVKKLNTNNNKYNNNKVNNNKEDISNSDELHKSSPINKKTIPSDQKEYLPHPLVEYWNSKPNLRTHRVPSNDYQNAAGMFNMLQNGVFGNIYHIDQEYVRKNHIKPDSPRRQFSENEIKEVIDKFDLMCSPDYVSKIKDKYPKSCSSFLYNTKTMTSFFMALYSSDKDIKPIKEEPLRKDVVDYYKENLRLKLNENEENDLNVCINFLEKRRKEYINIVGEENSSCYVDSAKFFKTHLKWVQEELFDRGKRDIWMIANRTSWGNFVNWLKKNYGFDYNNHEKVLEQCYN